MRSRDNDGWSGLTRANAIEGPESIVRGTREGTLGCTAYVIVDKWVVSGAQMSAPS
jgi:hypothetical protein